MISKYTIDYILHPQHNRRVDSHRTDDPVEAEDFLMHLLATGAIIFSIKHEGADLEEAKFTQMLRIAAERIASRLLEKSLHLDAAAVRHRFGLAA